MHVATSLPHTDVLARVEMTILFSGRCYYVVCTAIFTDLQLLTRVSVRPQGWIAQRGTFLDEIDFLPDGIQEVEICVLYLEQEKNVTYIRRHSRDRVSLQRFTGSTVRVASHFRPPRNCRGR